jgi:hypothetical protein
VFNGCIIAAGVHSGQLAVQLDQRQRIQLAVLQQIAA